MIRFVMKAEGLIWRGDELLRKKCAAALHQPSTIEERTKEDEVLIEQKEMWTVENCIKFLPSGNITMENHQVTLELTLNLCFDSAEFSLIDAPSVSESSPGGMAKASSSLKRCALHRSRSKTSRIGRIFEVFGHKWHKWHKEHTSTT